LVAVANITPTVARATQRHPHHHITPLAPPPPPLGDAVVLPLPHRVARPSIITVGGSVYD
jgi:hypothetical protein